MLKAAKREGKKNGKTVCKIYRDPAKALTAK